MNLEQIKELIASLESSKLKKLVVKNGDFELQLEKEGEVPTMIHLPPPYQPSRAVPAEHFLPAPESLKTGSKSISSVQPESIGRFVTSPMVGTFYASPSPEQPSFVKVGDRVEEDTVVCIIEAMKVMNEVKAGVKGTVVEILTDNSQPVEFGSKIFRIE